MQNGIMQIIMQGNPGAKDFCVDKNNTYFPILFFFLFILLFCFSKFIFTPMEWWYYWPNMLNSRQARQRLSFQIYSPLNHGNKTHFFFFLLKFDHPQHQTLLKAKNCPADININNNNNWNNFSFFFFLAS